MCKKGEILMVQRNTSSKSSSDSSSTSGFKKPQKIEVKKTPARKKPTCQFCSTKTEPDYKNVTVLKNFISEKGKILARRTTKLCAKHQRRVAKAIKRARILALLPFVAQYKD